VDSPQVLIRAGRTDRAARDHPRRPLIAVPAIDHAAIRSPPVAPTRLAQGTPQASPQLRDLGCLLFMRRGKERAEHRATRRRDDVDVIGRSDALRREKPLVTPRGSLYYPQRYQGKGTAAAATMLSGVAGA